MYSAALVQSYGAAHQVLRWGLNSGGAKNDSEVEASILMNVATQKPKKEKFRKKQEKYPKRLISSINDGHNTASVPNRFENIIFEIISIRARLCMLTGKTICAFSVIASFQPVVSKSIPRGALLLSVWKNSQVLHLAVDGWSNIPRYSNFNLRNYK